MILFKPHCDGSQVNKLERNTYSHKTVTTRLIQYGYTLTLTNESLLNAPKNEA